MRAELASPLASDEATPQLILKRTQLPYSCYYHIIYLQRYTYECNVILYRAMGVYMEKWESYINPRYR